MAMQIQKQTQMQMQMQMQMEMHEIARVPTFGKNTMSHSSNADCIACVSSANPSPAALYGAIFALHAPLLSQLANCVLHLIGSTNGCMDYYESTTRVGLVLLVQAITKNTQKQSQK